jgi:hypothetical protein
MSVILQCQSSLDEEGNRKKLRVCLFNVQEPNSATLELSDSFSDDGRIGRRIGKPSKAIVATGNTMLRLCTSTFPSFFICSLFGPFFFFLAS